MPDPTIETQHPDYIRAARKWRRGRDLYAGEDAIKANPADTVGGQLGSVSPDAYLPQPQGMDERDFGFYRTRAVYFNAYRRTVQALAGAVFRKPTRLEGAPPLLEADAKDVTMRDEPLELVAREVVAELLTVGRFGLLLDRPASGGRPYWVPIRAESITNWRVAPVGDDPAALVLVVIREELPPAAGYGHDCTPRYRELALVDGVYQVRLWELVGKALAAGPWLVPTRMGAPLPFIPFTFVGPRGVGADVEAGPLEDLGSIAIAHYRNSADHEHGLFLTALPTPWASGVGAAGGKLRIGPSVCWQLEQGGQAGMLEFSGAGLAAIREAMSAKERLMATLGARLLEEAGQETATAVRMRHSGDAAALDTIAGATAQALTRMARWHAWWVGAGPLPLDVNVSLPAEFFSTRASADEVRSALLLVQAEKMSFESFYALLEAGGWTREGVTAEQELAAIASESSRDLAPEADVAAPGGDPAADPAEGEGDPTDDGEDAAEAGAAVPAPGPPKKVKVPAHERTLPGAKA